METAQIDMGLSVDVKPRPSRISAISDQKHRANASVFLLQTDFRDDQHWQELAAKLTDYALPKYGVPCALEKMLLWLERMEISPRQYLNASGLKNLNEYVELNPAYPLRRFVGELLELKNERG